MKKLLYIFIIPLMIGVSCSDPEEEAIVDLNNEEQVDVTDADAVTAAITIPGATVVPGAPPAPSSDPNAPTLEDESGDVKAGAGVDASIDLYVPSGNVAGVYLQIKGASDYYDIPVSSLSSSGGRIEEGFELDIPIPDGLAAGTFCVDYCVYDAEARVSNVVEVCITIVELGGDNIEFLTANEWQMVKYEGFDQGVTTEEIVGQIYSEKDTTYLYLNDSTSCEVIYTEENRWDKLDFAFTDAGAVSFSIQEWWKELDYDNSTCDNVILVEETYASSGAGIFNYDDVAKTITMILEETESDGNTYTFTLEWDVETSGNQLIFSEEYDETGGGTITYGSTYYFEPKN